MEAIIQTNHLSKVYKGFHAVDDVSLEVNRGEVYGFIGLNGSGKTTTIRMLLGMVKPTQGSCYIGGKKVSLENHDIWKKVGYMVETPYAYPELTVRENLEIFHRLRAVTDKDAVETVIDLLKLKPYTDKKSKNLSLGNAQRLGIAKALLHNPEILILDEPVNGLDPAGIVEVRELLHELAEKKGITIFISSHLLSEVAKIATKIGIIHEGRLMQEIKSKDLNRILNQRLLMDVDQKELVLSLLAHAGISSFVNKEGLIETYNKRAVDHPEEIARLIIKKDLSLFHLTVEEEDLESYFLRVIGRNGG